MFCNINEASLAAVITIADCVLPCTQRNASLSAQRQTAFANAWCMSIALPEVDMGYAQI